MVVTLNTPPVVIVNLQMLVDSNGTPVGYADTLNFDTNFTVTADGYGTITVTDAYASFATFTFGRTGTQAVGNYLMTSDSVPGSLVGQIVPGAGIIARFGVGVSTAITGTPSVFQIQRRTAVATFADIAGATVSIPVGQFQATVTNLAILLAADQELSIYYKSGGVPANPVATIYVRPL